MKGSAFLDLQPHTQQTCTSTHTPSQQRHSTLPSTLPLHDSIARQRKWARIAREGQRAYLAAAEHLITPLLSLHLPLTHPQHAHHLSRHRSFLPADRRCRKATRPKAQDAAKGRLGGSASSSQRNALILGLREVRSIRSVHRLRSPSSIQVRTV